MVFIRKIKKSDTNNILKWRNSKMIMDVFIERNPLTKDQHLNWLETRIKNGEAVQFIAHDDINDKDFGSVYFKNIDKTHRKAEFGIFIGEEEYVGKGFGTTVSKQAIDYGFEHLDLNKIYARVLKYNKRSYNMFINLGFHKDAVLRQDVIIDGKPIDVCIVSILKEEWKNEE